METATTTIDTDTNTNTDTNMSKVEIQLIHESQFTVKHSKAMGTYKFPDGKQIIFGSYMFMIIEPSGKTTTTTYYDKGLIIDRSCFITEFRFLGTKFFFVDSSDRMFVCDIEKMIEPEKISGLNELYRGVVDFEFKKNQLYIYCAYNNYFTIYLCNIDLSVGSSIEPKCEYARHMVQKGESYYIKGNSGHNTKIYVIDSNGNNVSDPITEFQGTNGHNLFNKFNDIKYFFSLMNNSCDIMITQSIEGEINIYVVNLSLRTVVNHFQPFTDRIMIERVGHDEINNIFDVYYRKIDNYVNNTMLFSRFKVNKLLSVEEIHDVDEKIQVQVQNPIE